MIMGIVVYAMNYLHINQMILLVLQVSCGVLLYASLSFLSKNKNLTYCMNLLKRKTNENIERE